MPESRFDAIAGVAEIWPRMNTEHVYVQNVQTRQRDLFTEQCHKIRPLYAAIPCSTAISQLVEQGVVSPINQTRPCVRKRSC